MACLRVLVMAKGRRRMNAISPGRSEVVEVQEGGRDGWSSGEVGKTSRCQDSGAGNFQKPEGVRRGISCDNY